MTTAATRDDYDRYFQTDETLEAQERRAQKSGNTHGRPIRLPSKLSAICLDPTSIDTASFNPTLLASRVYVAGSDGNVRRVKIGSRNSTNSEGPQPITTATKPLSTSATAKADNDAIDLALGGPKAPLTCLAVRAISTTGVEVFAGCWDKQIWKWTIEGDKQIGRAQTLGGGHVDFVKCLALYSSEDTQVPPILISGSADKSLVFWNAATGEQISRIRSFSKSTLNALLVDPVAPTLSSSDGRSIRKFSVLSGSSEGEVAQTIFEVTASGEKGRFSVIATGESTFLENHASTVYGLALCGEDADLVTASADGTAVVMKRKETSDGNGASGWELDTKLAHEGHVRCVAAQFAGAGFNQVYTGGRDECVKLWDTATGEAVCTFEGHFDEITGLVVDGVYPHVRAISVSLDGTIRVWDQEEQARIAAGPREVKEDDDAAHEGEKPPQASLMTAEEEAELAALMEDDSD